MTISFGLLGALALFAFAASVTPGPNNTMLLASGVNFGVRRTVPRLAGVSAGVSAMLVVIGLGLGSVLQRSPSCTPCCGSSAARTCSSWHGRPPPRIPRRTSRRAVARPWGFGVRPRSSGRTRSRGSSRPARTCPMRIGPKSWIIATGAASAYLPHADWPGVVLAAGVFTAVAAPSAGSWAVFGSALRRFLLDPARMRVFNRAMAALLVLSLYPLAAGE